MKFDAYAGNVWKGSSEQVAELLSFGMKGRVVQGKPRGRYRAVYELQGMPLDGSVWVADDAQLETVYFEIKGAVTPSGVSTLRRHFPESHTVARMDSAEDYEAPDAYSQVVETVDSVCDPRVKSHTWQPRGADAATEGATTYWGSPQSRVMVRCYEAGKMKDRLHYGKPDWVRAEAQVRPGKAREKVLAASCTALDAWGFARWSRDAAERLAQVEVQRFAPDTTAPTYEKTELYLARAYRRFFETSLADVGDWTSVGRNIEQIWKLDDEARALSTRRGLGR